MPGYLHQAFVSVLRRRECALELGRQVGVPEYATELWRDVDAEFPDPAGRGSLYHADLAMVAFASGLGGDKGLAGLLFEPQLGIDPGKGVEWPIYWVSLRTRHACPIWQIVVSPDDAVIRWATKRLFFGEPQIPHVIGREHVEPVLDLERARANPAWAALSAALHARGPHARESAQIAIQACTSLPAEDRRCYLRLIYAGLDEDVMDTVTPSIPDELKWELTEYEREGGWFKHGLAEGRQEGRQEGQRTALLVAIESRGFELSDTQRAAIDACTDAQQLDRWLRRLFHVDTTEALLADHP